MIDVTGSTPLYQQLKTDIIRRVELGLYLPGSKIPGELELCGQYKLSRSTVRQALLELQEEGLLVRARGKGTYVSESPLSRVDPVSEELPGTCAFFGRFVGVVAPRPQIYLAPRITKAMESVLKPQGIGLKLYDGLDQLDATERVIEKAYSEGAVGLFIQPPEEALYSSRVAELQSEGFPIVLFDRPYRRLSTDCVMTDNVGGGFMATSHLIRLGHTRIAFVSFTGLETVSVASRFEGYLAALNNSGISSAPNYRLINSLRSCPDEVKYRTDWEAQVARLLTSEPRPTAVFGVNDVVATDLIRIAESVGLSVPRDLAVVGFDNASFSAMYNVPLTTVEQPLSEIGRRAAEMLFERLRGEVSEYKWVSIPGSLIVRNSCGTKQ